MSHSSPGLTLSLPPSGPPARLRDYSRNRRILRIALRGRPGGPQGLRARADGHQVADRDPPAHRHHEREQR